MTGEAAPTVEAEVEPEAAAQLDPAYHCGACGNEVTHRRHAIEVDGAHAHTFRNPEGWSFRVGCFAEASGAVPTGAATTEASWFTGCRWRFANCGACGVQLGWWYEGARSFAGLIMTRLT